MVIEKQRTRWEEKEFLFSKKLGGRGVEMGIECIACSDSRSS